MHFWIDKRSQASRYNGGRSRVPPYLLAGSSRRRSKPMVTPIHRLQSIESAQHIRRPHTPVNHYRQQPAQHAGQPPNISTGVANGSIISRSTNVTESDSSNVFLELQLEDGSNEINQQPSVMRVGRVKYGMWASFALATISFAAMKYYLDHQGSGVEVLLICGILCLTLIVTCILHLCNSKSAHEFMVAQAHPTRTGLSESLTINPNTSELQVIPTLAMSQATTAQVGVPTNTTAVSEPPPPPYHIAILLPPRESVTDESPPPTYEKAVS